MMTLKTLILVGAVLSLTGCATSQISPLPDGSDRKPVNSPVVLQQFQAQAAQTSTGASQSYLELKVQDQARQIDELKAYLVMINQEQEAMKSGKVGLNKETSTPVGRASHRVYRQTHGRRRRTDR